MTQIRKNANVVSVDSRRTSTMSMKSSSPAGNQEPREEVQLAMVKTAKSHTEEIVLGLTLGSAMMRLVRRQRGTLWTSMARMSWSR